MKKAIILAAAFAFLAVPLCMNCFAANVAGQITSLEQQTQRVKSQIEQAKKLSDERVNQQIQGVRNSIKSLINQRVQVDSQIASLENRIEQLKKTAQVNLDRQVQQYNGQLKNIKSKGRCFF